MRMLLSRFLLSWISGLRKMILVLYVKYDIHIRIFEESDTMDQFLKELKKQGINLPEVVLVVQH